MWVHNCGKLVYIEIVFLPTLEVNWRMCMDPQGVWENVLAELELSLSKANFSTWIKPVSLVDLNEEGKKKIAKVRVPSGFHQKIIEERYWGNISKVLRKNLGEDVELEFEISATEKAEDEKKEKSKGPLFATAKNKSKEDKADRGFLNPRLTFDTFVVGSSNNFAHAAAQGVISNPGKKYNPLFIYGGVGLGKTHLMHAIGHALLDRYPEYEILYIPTETFASELISSLQSKKTSSFKKRYRSCDVLLVDDIQFISGKEFTQEEFFHTFNELYMNQKQIILTSDRPPQEIPKVEERLSSRFMGGLTVDIQEPDYEMRIMILRQKMGEMGEEVENQALELIAENVQSNVRELEGVFRRIIAKAGAQGREVDEELVSEFFGVEKKRKSKKVRPASVIAKTAKYFEFKSSDLKSKSRKAPIANARHIAMYILKTELDPSYEKIGGMFGGRDHTTVMHGVEKISAAKRKDSQIRRDISEIKNLIFS